MYMRNDTAATYQPGNRVVKRNDKQAYPVIYRVVEVYPHIEDQVLIYDDNRDKYFTVKRSAIRPAVKGVEV